MEQPDPVPATGPLSANSHWAADRALVERLHTATLTLLDLLSLQLDDRPVFSEALAGGGEHVCELSDLAPSWAPAIEADAVRLVAEAAGLPAASVFSPAMPHMIAAIDRQPLDVQRALIQRASARHVIQGTAIPNAGFIAAIAQVPVRPPRYAPPTMSDRRYVRWSVEDARTTRPQPATEPDRTTPPPHRELSHPSALPRPTSPR
ncbi:hypothetical protein Sipo8835_15700 [Streptomyces ipomoeae]|uniref:Uncharacterized protein n=1 Tax=Streptomyces ipomoeae TaxID=103232 RepID=A0AAE9B139_9ACTN|nr:hypothetical protein [Streptomyces ipomoeae]TQE34192.1 hypothetical protein Sipo8835_15700 [Streptomyces ipomoeae]